MKYKYVFNSPIKFLIRADETDMEDIEVDIDDIKDKFNFDINDTSEKLLHSISKDFITYINRDGVLDIQFILHNGKNLETIVIMNHSLKKKDFIALFTDLEGQLFAGIGQKFANMPIYNYEDIIEYRNDKGMLEKKVAKKTLFCLLWQDHHWKLKFISK